MHYIYVGGYSMHPLFEAVWQNDLTALRRLLSEGANPNMRYQAGTFARVASYPVAGLRFVAAGWTAFWGSMTVLVGAQAVTGAGAAAGTVAGAGAAAGTVAGAVAGVIAGGVILISPGPIIYKLLSIRAISFDQDNWTPLHVAAVCAHVEAGRILIEYGANFEALDASGQTPRQIAEINFVDKAADKVLETFGLKKKIYSDFIEMIDSFRLGVPLAIRYEQLTIIQPPIGEGGFARVYIAQWKGEEVAAKQLRLGGEPPDQLRVAFERETRLMVALRHPNIVQIVGRCFAPPCIVMQYMPNGTLRNLLRTVDIPWMMRWNIATDIASGLEYLHATNTLHRDLKSANVLLDGENRARISDFGLSVIKATTASSSARGTAAVLYSSAVGLAGTFGWIAPEILCHPDTAHATKKTDIYSLGVLLWEIASRNIPSANAAGDMAVLMATVVRIVGGWRENIPITTPPSYAQLIRRCWEQRAEDRLTADMVRQELNLHRCEIETPPRPIAVHPCVLPTIAPPP